tara:strand:+ start:1639 stop:2175 length:537 start_codon:yes stop_codon:yes gene_type:complete
MANQKLTQKSALDEQTGSGDLYMVVDVSDSSSSADGTSKKIDSKFVIQTDKFSLSNAEVLDLNSNEKVLVGALSGYMITPISVTILCTYASATENQRKDLLFGFDDSIDTSYWSKVFDCMDGKTTDMTYIIGGFSQTKEGAWTTSTLNKPFICWSEGTGFTGGWSCDIYVTYCYTKVL